jgi:hypothetical protein
MTETILSRETDLWRQPDMARRDHTAWLTMQSAAN